MSSNKEDAPYGYCPICGAKGVLRERCLNGNDKCENDHEYPSSEAIYNKKIDEVMRFYLSED